MRYNVYINEFSGGLEMKKIIAAIMSLCIVGGSLPAVYSSAPECVITASAANYKAANQGIRYALNGSELSVEGFSVEVGEKEVASFTRQEFKSYEYDEFENEEDFPDERIVDADATLVIVGLNFERGSRWQFMYDGFKINITVKDDALMRKIDEGERFGKGDSVRVKLRKVQRYNKEYKAYENKSYKIVEFYEHIVPPKGGGLF